MGTWGALQDLYIESYGIDWSNIVLVALGLWILYECLCMFFEKRKIT